MKALPAPEHARSGTIEHFSNCWMQEDAGSLGFEAVP